MPERGDPSTIRVAGALILLFGLQTQRIHHPCADHVVLQHDNTYPTAGPHPIPLPPRLGSLTSSTCGSAGTAKRNCLADLNTYLDPVNYVFCDQDDDDKYTPHLWAYDYDKLADLFIQAGFSNTEPWTFDPDIANPKRQWGSVYIIATK
jgi:hypothetical protein